MLSRIKISPQDIRKALLSLEDDQLSIDDLKAISRQLPTNEEITRLKDFDDVNRLAKAEPNFSLICDGQKWLLQSSWNHFSRILTISSVSHVFVKKILNVE